MALEEVEPGRWRVKRKRRDENLRAENMPLPFVISDTMPSIEQVDGNFYDSKSAFRAVGRALGLTEVGNEKPKLRTARASAAPAAKAARRDAIKTAVEQFKSGVRPQGPHRRR